jgi:hypothetical protein
MARGRVIQAETPAAPAAASLNRSIEQQDCTYIAFNLLFMTTGTPLALSDSAQPFSEGLVSRLK